MKLYRNVTSFPFQIPTISQYFVVHFCELLLYLILNEILYHMIYIILKYGSIFNKYLDTLFLKSFANFKQKLYWTGTALMTYSHVRVHVAKLAKLPFYNFRATQELFYKSTVAQGCTVSFSIKTRWLDFFLTNTFLQWTFLSIHSCKLGFRIINVVSTFRRKSLWVVFKSNRGRYCQMEGQIFWKQESKHSKYSVTSFH